MNTLAVCVFAFTAWLGVFALCRKRSLNGFAAKFWAKSVGNTRNMRGEREGKESAVRRTWPRSKRIKVKAKRAKASTQWLKITVGYLSTPSADEGAGAGGSGEGLTHTHTQVCCACVNLKGLACVRLCRHMLREFMQVAGTES